VKEAADRRRLRRIVGDDGGVKSLLPHLDGQLGRVLGVVEPLEGGLLRE
jgi:hypothetical protein